MGGHLTYYEVNMNILDTIVAFFASALAAMGVGGGGLLVIYLTLVRGMEQIGAQGINLFFFLFGAFPALCVHMFKRKINVGMLIPLCVFGVIGTLFGYFILTILPIALLRKAFGALLLVSGVTALFKKEK